MKKNRLAAKLITMFLVAIVSKSVTSQDVKMQHIIYKNSLEFGEDILSDENAFYMIKNRYLRSQKNRQMLKNADGFGIWKFDSWDDTYTLENDKNLIQYYSNDTISYRVKNCDWHISGDIIVAAESRANFKQTEYLMPKSASIFKFSKQGILDTAFGDNGICRIDANLFRDGKHLKKIQVNRVKVLKSGKFLVLANVHLYNEQTKMPEIYLVIFRIDQFGTLDMTFGINGFIHRDIRPSLSTNSTRILVDSMNRILTSSIYVLTKDSMRGNYLVLDRFLEDGAIDHSFGKKGQVVICSDHYFFPSLMMFNDAQKLIVGGTYKQGTPPNDGDTDCFLVTLDLSNELNPVLEKNPFRQIDINATDNPAGLILTSDNGLILYGNTLRKKNTMYFQDFFFLKLNPDLTSDTNFGHSGMTVFNLDESKVGEIRGHCYHKNRLLFTGDECPVGSWQNTSPFILELELK